MKDKKIETVTSILLVLTLFLVGFNAIQINQLLKTDISTASQTKAESAGSTVGSSIDIIPKGIPDIYGKELSVSFNAVSPASPEKADATIRKLGILDVKLNLEGKELDRYISIASKISCEYCCGAKSIISNDGSAACGCAHSYAMRGLAKYLIQNHGKEYSDDQILEELGKWKTLFFPAKLTAKASVLKDKGIELNYINLASNNYRGIEQGVSGGGGMVGGC